MNQYWRDDWLGYIDDDIKLSQSLIASYESLEHRNHPVIKQAIKEERTNIREYFARKKEVHRRYNKWAQQTTGENVSV